MFDSRQQSTLIKGRGMDRMPSSAIETLKEKLKQHLLSSFGRQSQRKHNK